MAVEILFPQTGAIVGGGEVARWLARDGEQVTEGQPLFAIAGEPSGEPIEAPATGTLKINAGADRTYEAGAVLGYIE